ncbi:MAG TPA: methyl-accepting chemotaxis protein, partial [Chloroflexota bacterium]|nr:methyl-accepting chemotaxis protein [Chloroflexota bacterium]
MQTVQSVPMTFSYRLATLWQNITGFRRGRLAPRLILFCLFAAVLPLAAAVVIGGRAAMTTLQEQAEVNLQNYATSIAGQVEAALADRLKDSRILAADPAIVRYLATPADQRDPATQAAAQAAVERFVGADPSYTIGFLLSDKGMVQLSTDPALYNRPDLSFRAYFKEAMAGKPNVSDVSLGVNVQSTPAMFFTSPVKDAAGAIVGTATLRINAEAIWAYLDNAKLSSRSLTALVDEDGVVIGPGKPDLLWHSLGQLSPEAQGTVKSRFNLEKIDSLGLGSVATLLRNAQHGENTSRSGHTRFAFAPNGGNAEPTVAGYSQLSSRRWAILVMQPENEFLAPVQRATAGTVPMIAAVALFVVIWVVLAVRYAIRRQFQDPIKSMLGVMDLVRAGELEARVPVEANDELARLGDRLNETLDSLTELVQTREERDALQLRIQQLLTEVSNVADGDLTIQAEVTSDVTGALADAFNFMTDELRKIVSSIDNTTHQVTDSAGEVLVASQEMATASQHQARRIEEVSDAVRQMAAAISEVSQNATRSAGVAQDALTSAGRGGQAVTEMVEAMGRIRSYSYDTAQKIKRLGETSQRVGEIVQLIEDLADQTNLLALNAAIQAASAGEHGRGFAVVADEVRRLAERSATATKQIESLIHAIQTDTAAAVVAMEENTQQVVTGSRLADEAGASLGKIQQVVSDLAQLINAITASAHQHASASTIVVDSIKEVSSVTVRTA